MASRIDNLNALDWDDTALIKAYNRGMSLRVKDFEKEDNIAKKNYKNSKKNREWRVGDNCRAIYHGDDLWYEAKIVSIDGDMCTVDFIGYDEEAEVELDSLDKSLGKKAIKKQRKNAKKNSVSSDVDENTSESSSHPYQNHSRREYPRNNETTMFDDSRFYATNYPTADTTFHSGVPYNTAGPVHTSGPVLPMPKCPDVATVPIPPSPEVIQNSSFSSMLSAWYMAGYYTGLHQAQKSSSQQGCCCRQNHNCHQ